MKTIEVSAAIICRGKEFLATQRGYGAYRGLWEFPGGKIEHGETPSQALQREIKEELKTNITINELLITIEYDYDDFHLIMHCFLCELKNNNYVLAEHSAARWLMIDEIDSIEWLPADRLIMRPLESYLTKIS